ncbi:MAG: ROK family protein, partial [Alistipes sp.]|nr:ROK family protein [Alistipes sp.]
GMVVGGQLHRGAKSCVETFCLPHKKLPGIICEDGAAIRAVRRVYGELSGNPGHGLEPKQICEIADGTRDGDRQAARQAFAELGEIAGDAIATAVTLTDSLVVIGGGITAARRHIMPALLQELRSKMHQIDGSELDRVQMKVYDLDNDEEFAAFAKGDMRPLQVYGTDRYVAYDPQKRTGVMISKLGASKAISVGAYAFALSRLDEATR